MADEVDAALDRLYGVPLDEFVAQRKAISAELRAAGRREGARLVAKATKPSVSAWAVNQLARRNRPAVDELLAAGERLVSEQAAALRGGGEEFEQAQRVERAVVRQLVDGAAKILDIAGRPASTTVRERLAATLRAAAVDDEGRELLARGRLTRDLEPAGFDALAAMAATMRRGGVARPRPRGTTSRPRVEKQPERDERRERLAAAREELAAARTRVRERERAARDADHLARAAEKAAREAEQEAARARRDADEARERARAATAAAEEAAAEVTEAESAVADARREAP